MPLVEVIRGPRDERRDGARVRRPARGDGQDGGRGARLPRLPRQPHAPADAQRGGLRLYEGVGDAEAIDTVMRLGMNHPLGPLALADFIGLDTCLAILEVLHEGFGDPKYRPCPLWRQYVEAGWLGRKAGRGFYAYG